MWLARLFFDLDQKIFRDETVNELPKTIGGSFPPVSFHLARSSARRETVAAFRPPQQDEEGYDGRLPDSHCLLEPSQTFAAVEVAAAHAANCRFMLSVKCATAPKRSSMVRLNSSRLFR